jgi:hypothetical protein
MACSSQSAGFGGMPSKSHLLTYSQFISKEGDGAFACCRGARGLWRATPTLTALTLGEHLHAVADFVGCLWSGFLHRLPTWQWQRYCACCIARGAATPCVHVINCRRRARRLPRATTALSTMRWF